MSSSSFYSSNALLNILSIGLDSSPDESFILFLDNDTQITRKAFFSRCECFCAFFLEIGIKPGDRIVVQSPKTTDSLCLYISAIMAGGIYIPLNPDFTDAEVSYYLNDSKPTIFICMPERAKSLMKIASESDVPFTYTIGTKDIGTFYEEVYLRDAKLQKSFPEKRRI